MNFCVAILILKMGENTHFLHIIIYFKKGKNAIETQKQICAEYGEGSVTDQTCQIWFSRTAGQDGGIGRHTVPPCTTKRRTTTNLETKNNQNWYKVKLYGSPTTKELKKKHSSRLLGGAETWGWASRQRRLAARRPLVEWAVPHLHADKPGQNTAQRDTPCNPQFQPREIKTQNLWLNNPLGVALVGKTPSLTGEFTGDTNRVQESTQTYTPRNQHQKGPIWLWVAGGVTENRQRAGQAPLLPLGPLPHIQCHSTARWVALPWGIPKALPLTM